MRELRGRRAEPAHGVGGDGRRDSRGFERSRLRDRHVPRDARLEQQLGALVQRNEKLEQLNACFEAALNHMGRGLSMFDSEQHLVVCNKAYADIYNLPTMLARPGTPFVEILCFHMNFQTMLIFHL